MITNQEWEKLENLLDRKLEQKLEQKLEEKLDQKLDERFGEFAIMMKNSFDEVYRRFDKIELELKGHDRRITQNELDISLLKRAL